MSDICEDLSEKRVHCLDLEEFSRKRFARPKTVRGKQEWQIQEGGNRTVWLEYSD